MKNTLFWTALACFVVGSLTPSMGGGHTVTFHRNPFYYSVGETTFGCSYLRLNITNPQDDSLFIFPSHTINLTLSISGMDETSASCYYKVKDGSWNTFSMCLNGVNNTHQRVTLPEGESYDIIAYAVDDYCLTGKLDSRNVTVIYRPGRVNARHSLIPLAFGGLGVFLLPLGAYFMFVRKKQHL